MKSLTKIISKTLLPTKSLVLFEKATTPVSRFNVISKSAKGAIVHQLNIHGSIPKITDNKLVKQIANQVGTH